MFSTIGQEKILSRTAVTDANSYDVRLLNCQILEENKETRLGIIAIEPRIQGCLIPVPERA